MLWGLFQNSNIYVILLLVVITMVFYLLLLLCWLIVLLLFLYHIQYINILSKAHFLKH